MDCVATVRAGLAVRSYGGRHAHLGFGNVNTSIGDEGFLLSGPDVAVLSGGGQYTTVTD